MASSVTLLRGRLLRSARLLLDWSQARLACEAGISTSTVYAVEAGRLSTTSPAGRAMIQVLKFEGVVLLSADQGGPGLRYVGDADFSPICRTVGNGATASPRP